MQKRGIYILFILLGLLGFFIGRETKLTGLQVNNVGNLTVNVVSAVAFTMSDAAQNMSFGTSLDPGRADNASQNVVGLDNVSFYNITNDATSTTPANISIRGSDFISGANRVGIGNVSWASNTTVGNASNMVYPGTAISTNFDTTNRIAAELPIGSTVWYRMWLAIPSTTGAGTFTGNFTIRVEEA